MNTAIRSLCIVPKRMRRQDFTKGLALRTKSVNVEKTTRGHEAYCMEIVKKRDWEGYISTLLLPRKARRSAFAVRAFNAEISQVAGNVSESALGYMRLHFWKNSLDSVFEAEPPESPVTQELHRAVLCHKLSKSWLKRMIQAREEKLSEVTFRSIREVEDYADDTSIAQLCLILQCLGVADVHADHVASHVGRCQGIVTMIRAVPYYAVRRKTQLPTDSLIKHSVSQEEIFRGSQEQNVKEMIFDIAGQANVHLQHAKSLSDKISTLAKKAFLVTASLEWYLKQLQLVDFDPFHPKLQERNNKLPVTVLLRTLLRKI